MIYTTGATNGCFVPLEPEPIGIDYPGLVTDRPLDVYQPMMGISYKLEDGILFELFY